MPAASNGNGLRRHDAGWMRRPWGYGDRRRRIGPAAVSRSVLHRGRLSRLGDNLLDTRRRRWRRLICWHVAVRRRRGGGFLRFGRRQGRPMAFVVDFSGLSVAPAIPRLLRGVENIHHPVRLGRLEDRAGPRQGRELDGHQPPAVGVRRRTGLADPPVLARITAPLRPPGPVLLRSNRVLEPVHTVGDKNQLAIEPVHVAPGGNDGLLLLGGRHQWCVSFRPSYQTFSSRSLPN